MTMLRTLLLLWLTIFVNFQGFSQQFRNDSWQLGAGAGAIIYLGSSGELSQNYAAIISPAFQFQYAKQLSTFWDIKANLGLIPQSDGFFKENLFSPGRGPSSFRGRNLMHIELVPTLYTNPDRAGYVPAFLKFYFGLGLGWMQTGYQEQVAIELGENEMALVEYGFLDPIQIQENSLRSFYIPLKVGMRHTLNERWFLSTELGFSALFSGNYSNQSLSIPVWSQWQVAIGKRIYN